MAKKEFTWKPWMTITSVILVLVVILLSTYISIFNSLNRADVAVDGAWSDVEVQYQRRADLIPNLVATVQGAADFESETQTAIADLRTAAVQARNNLNSAQTREEEIAAAQQIDNVVEQFRGLNINVENYPELRATENFLALQDQLEGTENRVSVARIRYNEEVTDFNTRLRTFPSNIIANSMGLEAREFFESNPGSETAPEVVF
jgi:LemA protein